MLAIVDERTIERYLENYSTELNANGYTLCKGKALKEIKLQFAHVINVGSKWSKYAQTTHFIYKAVFKEKSKHPQLPLMVLRMLFN